MWLATLKWRNNVMWKEEKKNQSEQAKSDCSLAGKKKEEKHFSKINSSDKDKGDVSVTQIILRDYFR